MTARWAAGRACASAGNVSRLRTTPVVAARVLVACAALMSFSRADPAFGADAKSTGPTAKEPQQSRDRGVETSSKSPPRLASPDAGLTLTLIRTTLLTLNDALHSDNFTVLRDISSTLFRNAHTAGGLSRRFSGLAQQGIDLSAVAVLTPKLSEPPSIDAMKGLLRLRGHFDGRPVGLQFDLVFAAEGAKWKVLGLSVQPTATPEPPAEAPHTAGGK